MEEDFVPDELLAGESFFLPEEIGEEEVLVEMLKSKEE